MGGGGSATPPMPSGAEPAPLSPSGAELAPQSFRMPSPSRRASSELEPSRPPSPQEAATEPTGRAATRQLPRSITGWTVLRRHGKPLVTSAVRLEPWVSGLR
jgi:hypothetical protein